VIRLRSIALVAQVGLAAATAGIAVTIATLIPDLLQDPGGDFLGPIIPWFAAVIVFAVAAAYVALLTVQVRAIERMAIAGDRRTLLVVDVGLLLPAAAILFLSNLHSPDAGPQTLFRWLAVVSIFSALIGFATLVFVEATSAESLGGIPTATGARGGRERAIELAIPAVVVLCLLLPRPSPATGIFFVENDTGADVIAQLDAGSPYGWLIPKHGAGELLDGIATGTGVSIFTADCQALTHATIEGGDVAIRLQADHTIGRMRVGGLLVNDARQGSFCDPTAPGSVWIMSAPAAIQIDCGASSIEGILRRSAATGLGVDTGSGSVEDVRWPAGDRAQSVDGRIRLLGPGGDLIAVEGSRVRVVGVLYDTTGFNGCSATAASSAP